MRISNQTPVNSSNTPTSSVARPDSSNTNAPAAPVSSSALPSASAQDYSVVPSFELQSLTAVLSEIPAVRQDVISETIQRLAAGDLRSSNALERVASAMLGH